MTNARIRSPLARRASLIDARNRNERNDQIFANTLSAYIVPARDSRSKNVRKRNRELLPSLAKEDPRGIAAFAV